MAEKSLAGNKLPSIKEKRGKRQRPKQEETDVENPFYVPLDEDIFKVKEMERQSKKLEREKNFNRNIWDKGVDKTDKVKIKNDIKNLRKDIMSEKDDERKEIGLIEAADNALKNRIVQREQMQKFIEKKREMFLMQMSIDQKKKQIKQLEELIHTKTRGLEKAENAIISDLSRFNNHMIQNKRESNELTKQADIKAAEKQKALRTLKNRNEQQAKEISKNTKRLETLEEYYRYKEFIDKLAQDEFENYEDWKSQREEISEKRKQVADNTGSDKIRVNEIYKLSLPQGLIQLINSPDEKFKPYFQKSSDIMRIFHELEEKNLKLIRESQELEQANDKIQETKGEMKEKYSMQVNQMLHKKEQLKGSIKEKKRQIFELEKVKSASIKEVEEVTHHLETAINELYGSKVNKKNPLELLTEIEKKIDFQLRVLLQETDPKLRAEKEQAVFNEKKKRLKDLQDEKLQLESKEKSDNLKSKHIKKRIGRPIMFKHFLDKGDDNADKDDLIDRVAEYKRMRHLQDET